MVLDNDYRATNNLDLVDKKSLASLINAYRFAIGECSREERSQVYRQVGIHRRKIAVDVTTYPPREDLPYQKIESWLTHLYGRKDVRLSKMVVTGDNSWLQVGLSQEQERKEELQVPHWIPCLGTTGLYYYQISISHRSLRGVIPYLNFGSQSVFERKQIDLQNGRSLRFPANLLRAMSNILTQEDPFNIRLTA